MEQVVGLSGKERERLVELEQVRRGRQTLVEAGKRLGISERQSRRVWKRFQAEGARGLVHRSRGRRSNRALSEETRRRSLELYRERLEGFGPTLAAEKLAEAGLKVDAETLRRWLMAESLWRRRRKRGPHRRWRPRKEHFGELVQMDGSFHAWFETAEQPCLIDMVDDATGRMAGRFFEQETTEGAMRVLWGWIGQYGIPRALYTDRKTVYVTPREPSREEQLAGQPALTAFGRACHKLGIAIIPAASPQAKGRVERRHGVLQDRLVKEMRLAGVGGIEQANDFLLAGFLQSINEKFGYVPASPVDLHRPVPKGLRLEDIFVFEDWRSVQSDGTVVFEGQWFQITGPSRLLPRRGARVLLRRRLDGSRLLLHK
jgi:transposase